MPNRFSEIRLLAEIETGSLYDTGAVINALPFPADAYLDKIRFMDEVRPDGIDLESPETAAIWAVNRFIGRGQALDIALEAETANHAFRQKVRDTTDDPEIKVLAKEFAEEENGHVTELHTCIAAHQAGLSQPLGI